MKNDKTTKIKNLIAWIIAGLLTVLFIYSAFGKFIQPENMVKMNLGDWKMIIPIGEILSAMLFLIPKTNKFGTLLLSSYMGGAVIIHMTYGTSILLPSAVLILVWIVGFLRNPQLLKI